MEVKYWTSYKWATENKKDDLSSLSGSEYEEMKDAVISDIRQNCYDFGGPYHQNGDFGVPVLSNGYALCCSFRAWGEIMYAAHNEGRSDGMGYCEYAWNTDDGLVPGPNKPTTAEKMAGKKKKCHFKSGQVCETCKYYWEVGKKFDVNNQTMEEQASYVCGNKKNHLSNEQASSLSNEVVFSVSKLDSCDFWEAK